MVALPEVAGVSPTMTRMVVVLPAPLGPRKPVTVPGWQTKLMLSTAVNVPYFRVSPSTLIMGTACRIDPPIAEPFQTSYVAPDTASSQSP